jgi:hypothetical protein
MSLCNISEPHTANEGLVRIQYEMKLLFPKQNYNVLSPNSYTHISVRDLYIQNWSIYFAAAKYVDRSWEYISRSQTHFCRNWD